MHLHALASRLGFMPWLRDGGEDGAVNGGGGGPGGGPGGGLAPGHPQHRAGQPPGGLRDVAEAGEVVDVQDDPAVGGLDDVDPVDVEPEDPADGAGQAPQLAGHRDLLLYDVGARVQWRALHGGEHLVAGVVELDVVAAVGQVGLGQQASAVVDVELRQLSRAVHPVDVPEPAAVVGLDHQGV